MVTAVFFTFLTLYLAIHRSYHLPQTRIIMSLNRYTKLVVNFGLQSRKFSAVATMASCQAIRPQTPTGFQMHLLRSFHATTISLAKPKKGGNSKATDDGEGVPLPDVKQADARMEQQLSTLSAELAKFKIGKASTETFNNIQVEGFGTVVSAGQITLKSASKVEIAVYDPSMVKAVRDAIKDSGLGVNPQVEGNLVLVNIPKPSKESRDSMVKAASKVAEQSKQSVRQVRKELMDALKKCKGSASEDDIKRRSKEIDTLTEKKVDKVTQMMKAKEKELLMD